jgi:hypothetical protein
LRARQRELYKIRKEAKQNGWIWWYDGQLIF